MTWHLQNFQYGILSLLYKGVLARVTYLEHQHRRLVLWRHTFRPMRLLQTPQRDPHCCRQVVHRNHPTSLCLKHKLWYFLSFYLARIPAKGPCTVAWICPTGSIPKLTCTFWFECHCCLKEFVILNCSKWFSTIFQPCVIGRVGLKRFQKETNLGHHSQRSVPMMGKKRVNIVFAVIR